MRECPKCEKCLADDAQLCPFDGNPTKFTLPGSTLLANRYLLEKRLGRGAMGQVYLARDENLGTRRVAVKTVRPDLLDSEDLQQGEAIARFEREARTAASISHPHVVDVTDFGKSAEGVFYLVMEYVEGETLHHLLRREGTLPLNRAVKLLEKIAEGVEAAHEAGILHRDLKPANIFLMKKKRLNQPENAEDNDGFIKVGDFGLAKIVTQAQSSENQSAGGPASRGIIGTPEFMAPEQMQSDGKIDIRADIYALGTIAYLMLGGKTPFNGELMHILTQKLMNPPPPLSTLRSDIAPAVEKVIMRALAKDPAERQATVREWITELEKAAETQTEKPTHGAARLVVMAQIGAEVYVDDERRGSIGSSGKLVINAIPLGKHILRVSLAKHRDDERVIEIRDESAEQLIQAQLKHLGGTASHPQPMSYESQAPQSYIPGVVGCLNCGARYAAGVRFCGRCGKSEFQVLSEGKINVSSEYISTNRSGAASAGSASTENRIINFQKPFPCVRCRTMLPAGARFCGKCGLNLEQYEQFLRSKQTNSAAPNSIFETNAAPRPVQVVCPVCRTAYNAGTRFCGKCGQRLS